jgi:hypothetical protein
MDALEVDAIEDNEEAIGGMTVAKLEVFVKSVEDKELDGFIVGVKKLVELDKEVVFCMNNGMN